MFELQAISKLRATLSGAADDSGILINGTVSLVPTDLSSITFARNANQVRNFIQGLTVCALISSSLQTICFREHI